MTNDESGTKEKRLQSPKEKRMGVNRVRSARRTPERDRRAQKNQGWMLAMWKNGAPYL